MFSKKTLILIAVFAFAVRITYIFTFGARADFFAEADSGLYWELSDHIVSTLSIHTLRTPGYPLFIWFCRQIYDSPRWVAIIQSAIDAATCAMIARLGIFIGPSIGVVSGILSAISLSFIIYSSQMLSDTLAIFLQTSAMLAFTIYLLDGHRGPLVSSAILLALAVLVRPSALMLLPFFIIVLLVHARLFQPVIVFACVFSFAISPLVVRNYLHYGRLALTTVGGEHLLDWIDPLARQRENGIPYAVTRERNAADLADAMKATGLDADSNPFLIEDLKKDIAIRDLSKINHSTFVKLWLEGGILNLIAPATIGDPRVREIKDKPSFYATSGTSFFERSVAYIKSSDPTYLAMLAIGALWSVTIAGLALFGFAFLIQINWRIAALVVLPIIYCLGISGPVASAKYRLPMEPSLVLLASVLICRRSIPNDAT